MGSNKFKLLAWPTEKLAELVLLAPLLALINDDDDWGGLSAVDRDCLLLLLPTAVWDPNRDCEADIWLLAG